VAIHNFESVYKRFPAATTRAPEAGNKYMHGPTWWVYILPYIEQDNVYNRTTFSSVGGVNESFWFADTGAVNKAVYNGIKFSMIRCPSSTLPEWNLINRNDYQAYEPTYTCILGSSRHPSTDTTSGNGPVSDGGVLVLRQTPEQAIRITDITDGASNTIMVAEQSAWSDPLQAPVDIGPTGGPPDLQPIYSDMRSSDSRGAFMGTSYVAQPRGPGSLIGCGIPGGSDTNCKRCYNTTTIHTAGISRTFVFAQSGDEKCNTPLNSAHTGGINSLFADGSVRFLNSSIPLDTLKTLVDRDDGIAVSLP